MHDPVDKESTSVDDIEEHQGEFGIEDANTGFEVMNGANDNEFRSARSPLELPAFNRVGDDIFLTTAQIMWFAW